MTNDNNVYKFVINGNHTHAEGSLAINLLIKHARDEIASILCWEDEAVGPGSQAIAGGLDLWEESTQHVARVGYYSPK